MSIPIKTPKDAISFLLEENNEGLMDLLRNISSPHIAYDIANVLVRFVDDALYLTVHPTVEARGPTSLRLWLRRPVKTPFGGTEWDEDSAIIEVRVPEKMSEIERDMKRKFPGVHREIIPAPSNDYRNYKEIWIYKLV